MYEERREKFTVRDIILQVLIVALFIFLLIWLFPTKGFMNKKVDPLLDTIFNTNVMTMKEAAKSYFTLERLPQKEGDKVKLTLDEMLELKLLLPFSDKYGKSCDLSKSYVEVIKKDTEYEMKVYLKCSKQEDYIIVHMGCYDYCSTTICEKKDEEIKDSNDKPVKPVIPTPQPDKKYICEYSLNKGGYYTDWTAWTDWNKCTDNCPQDGKFELKEVETKKETTTEERTTQIGWNIYEKWVPIKETVTYVTGTKKTEICDVWGKSSTYDGVVKYTGEKLMGYIYVDTPPTSGNGNKFVYVKTITAVCEGNCSTNLTYVYEWYQQTYDIIYKEDPSSVTTKCIKSHVDITPTKATKEIIVRYEKEIRKEPVYKTEQIDTITTYYRDRTRKYVDGSSDLKWSKCNDTDLLNKGWKFTGNKKEA